MKSVVEPNWCRATLPCGHSLSTRMGQARQISNSHPPARPCAATSVVAQPGNEMIFGIRSFAMKTMQRMVLGLAIVAILGAGSLAYAGAIGGPRWAVNQWLAPFHTVDYQVAFAGGQLANIAAEGNGATDLDMFVYDQYGNQVFFDTRYGDFCEAHFWVSYPQVYTVRVVNRGSLWNVFSLVTN